MFLNSINFAREIAAEKDEEDIEGAVESALTELEKKRRAALDHVKSYKTQRAFANVCMKRVQDQRKNELPYHKLDHCLTIDMGQNLGFPHFEAEQVGDTYYFTPLNVFVFGVNDNSQPNGSDKMNAYVWHEKDGRRGANNIGSCLYKDYKLRGFFDTTKKKKVA